MSRPPEENGTIDIGECFECNKEINISTCPSDPNGNPLCVDCFNILVRQGVNRSDDIDLV